MIIAIWLIMLVLFIWFIVHVVIKKPGSISP